MKILKYVRYSRKSSESKEKQALSIRDQNKEADEYIVKNDLEIVKRLEESKSAFKPHNRPEFDKMIALIREEKANAILTWKPDRLCRNPEEGGLILQMLQDGLIKEIRTVLGDVYTQDSDHLILQIHFGMANQYSRNLSQNVNRGYRRKIYDRKEYYRPAPIGYVGFGQRGQRNIRPHPIDSQLILKAFKLSSTGLYSLNTIVQELYDDGLRTRRGNKVSKSHLSSILVNPVYYGHFYYKNEICDGNFEPIITKGLFDLVQEKLIDRSRPKQVVWEREFAKIFKCGNCGCTITTTIKKKFVKKLNTYKLYRFHHCTYRRGNCTERPVTDDEFKQMLYRELDRIHIDKDVWELGMKLIKAKYSGEVEKNKNQLQYIHQQQQSVRDQITRLIEMRSGNELTKEEFIEQKERLMDKLAKMNDRLQDNEHSVKTWLELAEDFFNSAFSAKEVIENGNATEKQLMLTKIGENFFMKDRKIVFNFRKPFDVLLKSEYRTNVLALVDFVGTFYGALP